MHSISESVVECQSQGARGAWRGGRTQHAACSSLRTARRHQQRARVRHRRRALPAAPRAHFNFFVATMSFRYEDSIIDIDPVWLMGWPATSL